MIPTYPQRDGQTVLTRTEYGAQKAKARRNCWSCTYLVRYKRGGYRSCELDNDVQPVIAGKAMCDAWGER